LRSELQVWIAKDLPVEDHTRAQPGADRHHDDPLSAFSQTESLLGEERQARIVVGDDGKLVLHLSFGTMGKCSSPWNFPGRRKPIRAGDQPRRRDQGRRPARGRRSFVGESDVISDRRHKLCGPSSLGGQRRAVEHAAGGVHRAAFHSCATDINTDHVAHGWLRW